MLIPFSGGETRKELAEALRDSIETLNKLISETTIEAGGKTYCFRPTLTCDMKTLTKVLGTYNTFHPSSRWRCMWCAVQKNCLGDFDIEKWDLHTEEVIRNAEAAVKKATSKGYDTEYCARKHYGIRDERLFKFPRQAVISCNLHCFMGIMRKLLNLMAIDIEDDIDTVKAFEEALGLCNVKVTCTAIFYYSNLVNSYVQRRTKKKRRKRRKKPLVSA